ncbi:MAG: hypothetical protein AAGJ18_19220 [Bacteroidota bacterium]
MTLEKQYIDKIVPKRFIYEMDEGVPIYYKGTKAYLEGTNENLEPMPDSLFQSWLKGKIYLFLSLLMMDDPKYDLTVGEQGLSLKKSLLRAVDIAIFTEENIDIKSNHYSKKPPVVAFEIDLKGEFDTPEKLQQDHQRKIKQLFGFGVEKIIWIYTNEEEVKIITPAAEQTFSWDKDINVLNQYTINIQEIIKKYSNH